MEIVHFLCENKSKDLVNTMSILLEKSISMELRNTISTLFHIDPIFYVDFYADDIFDLFLNRVCKYKLIKMIEDMLELCCLRQEYILNRCKIYQ